MTLSMGQGAESPLRMYQVECSIAYCHLEDNESPPIGDYLCRVGWLHIPTGKKGVRRLSICSGSQRSALVLVNHWNRTEDWKYTLME